MPVHLGATITVMQEWLVPTTLKQLRGFLGLTGYRRFIKNYELISKPLTDLLRKNAFQWNKVAQSSFEQLKSTMASAPVLAFFSALHPVSYTHLTLPTNREV